MIDKNNKKLVYFCGAIRGDRTYHKIIKELIKFIKEKGTPVLTEHVGEDNPIRAFAEKIGKKEKELIPADIEKQDIYWLDMANYVIAEISGASTGVGREIEYARTKEKFGKTPAKILCLYDKSKEFNVSPMIKGMTQNRYPNIQISSYSNLEEAKSLIDQFLSKS